MSSSRQQGAAPHDGNPDFIIDPSEAQSLMKELRRKKQKIELREDEISDLEAENERLRREQKDMLLSLLSRTGRAKGKMREMQENGSDPQHSRLREGRYEALNGALDALSDIASADISTAALDRAEDGSS